MGRLGWPGDQATFAQEIPFDRVRRDKNVGRLWVKMIFRGAKKTKAFFGDFQITGTKIRCAIRLSAHMCFVSIEKSLPGTTLRTFMNLNWGTAATMNYF